MNNILQNQLNYHIEPLDAEAIAVVQHRLDHLTKPQGSLGRLEQIACQLAGIQCRGTARRAPTVARKTVFVMAADHGVTEEGISAYPKEVTAQMVLNFLRGGAAINVLARQIGAKVIVVDMGVAYDFKEQKGLIHAKVAPGTKNFLKEPAMSTEQLQQAIRAGWDLAGAEIQQGVDLLAIGDMGIGNTTAASALTAVLCNREPLEVTGHGTGIGEDARFHKANVIRRAIAARQPIPEEPLDVLQKLGGFEIAGMVGVILRAAQERVPLVLDGFITSAAGLVAYCLEPKLKDFLFASHLSVERGHQVQLEKMGLMPLLNLGLRLGEGTGAVLAMHLLEAACRILSEMATFEQAGVSERE
ncbi:MAG: nicotinate-nucleotide--dimethylbenzimidazole phosphoribosyltransferase [Candidatus Omnitrophica bacterium]|nr:nicotinate-nucleotide--dimethylbenzimidazole phosphoribosyltransferase [Candidatus Omnitrophota bacterium]